MDTRDYLILAGMAALVVVVGAVTTTKPLDAFLVDGVIEAVRTTVAMAWITWWALVFGFAIAGGVEAWVDSDDIAHHLAGNGPRELALGAFFGFVSSSCSYSAIATAKNLYKKGASAGASLGAFMFASTNLVIEIGFVIWLLLGWQFVVADFLGGVVLIVLLALAFRYLVPDDVLERAREHATDDDTVSCPNCGMDVDPDETAFTRDVAGTTYYFCSRSCMESWDPDEANTTIREKATSLAGWRDLADKQYKEWGMLYDEIALGFVFAGILAGFVPQSVWTALFGASVLDSPALTVVAMAVLGAVVGVVTFVCSVGNVPFGALLYTEGLPFGGVLSYIYADLIIPPIMEAYREYYGGTFAAVLSAIIFVAAVVTGVLVHAVFVGLHGLTGITFVPAPATTTVTELHVELNYKAVLNALAVIVFAVLYWLHATDDGGDMGHGGHGGHGHDSHDHSEHGHDSHGSQEHGGHGGSTGD
ncbi:probable integral membrane protein [Halarchaeum acidiphilum MH1-52-1]|uniref:Probable integral membrane protein n=1 Tax=Halarchaeum acidiphilum MH1-52-1 TaxID=1261545 RepID=U2YGV0_9EURY|nr:permease [Halarchaeum acidiphilum]GAD53601.1 probable integral membrane protein [Halarchaeum acidiphilum MH1-52-1]